MEIINVDGVEIQRNVNPDGSYTELIINHLDNSGIIHEYDAQGNLIRSMYGHFSDEPELSDEEVDDYIMGLLMEMDSDNEDFQEQRTQDY